MDKLGFYFKQVVGDADLNQLQTNVDTARKQFFVDCFTKGILSGGAGVVANSPNNMTVDAPANMIVYDANGDRMKWATDQNVNCAVDEDGAATVPTVIGQERYITILVGFTRTQETPRTDGEGDTVYYNQNASYEFTVIRGVAAAAGDAVVPADPADGRIILGDVLLAYGDTQITSDDINYDRVPKVSSLFEQRGAALSPDPPTAVQRGRLFTVEGGAGIPDKVYIALKKGDDTFEWWPLV